MFTRKISPDQQTQEHRIHYPIIHTNYWISGWVGLQMRKILGAKQLHTYHSLGCVKYCSVDNIPPIAETRLKYERQILENAEFIIATSPEEERHMRTYMSTIGDIQMVPCGTNVKVFKSINRQEARKRLHFKQNDKIVLYVGRFDYRKGIETLVRAVNVSKFRNDSSLKLVIAGGWIEGGSDGDERQRIGRVVTECNLTDITIFTGQLGPKNLHLYYAAADCCVVPSYYEPFGLVTIEAMASSTPVVGSDLLCYEMSLKTLILILFLILLILSYQRGLVYQQILQTRSMSVSSATNY
ncbi:D-inositol 3-phosphate glycosyltransferase, partial [Pseudolycoriella hygida]